MAEKIVWLEESLADQFESLKGGDEQERLVRQIIERKRLDLTRDLEALDDNVLAFKSACLTHKKALEDAYNAEDEKLEALFNDMGSLGGKVKKHATEMAAEIKEIRHDIDGLTSSVKKLNDALQSLNVYGANDLIKVTEQITQMNDATRKLLMVLVKGE